MAKLIDDPKVAELVEKEAVKAAKLAVKNATAIVKEEFASVITSAKEDGNKEAVKVLTATMKAVLVALKTFAE